MTDQLQKKAQVIVFSDSNLLELEDEINDFLIESYEQAKEFKYLDLKISQTVTKEGKIATTIFVVYEI